MVEVYLVTKGGEKIPFRATVTKQITGPLQRVPMKIKDKNDLQRRFDLADTLPTKVENYALGILIGNDHYYDVILSEREEIQKNLYLVKLKLMWIMMDYFWMNLDR